MGDGGRAVETDGGRELQRILDSEEIVPVYQQLVDLATGRTVGYEALARGPAGSSLESPGALFDTARATQSLRRLDWMCRTAAVRGALGRLRPPLALFLNSEPETIGSRVPVAFAESWAQAHIASLPLVFEVTERAVMDRPAQLLRAVDQIRHFGWGVALDDVGTNPASLALLPFLDPDVIKLDMGLLHGTAADIGEVVLAVSAEAERSGAVVLAEGIETADHLEVALAMGATLGQGWFFGRPGPLPENLPPTGSAITVRRNRKRADPAATPYRVVSERVPSRRARSRHLQEASRLIERRALELPHPPLLLAAFQEARRFTGRTQAIYEEMARRLPFVAALAHGWDGDVEEAPRRVELSRDDPLTREWVVGIITPFSAMLLCANEVGAPGERVFDACMTFDRDLVIEAAETFIQRLDPPDADADAAVDEEDVEFAEAVAEILAEAEYEQDLVRPLLEAMAEVTGLDATFLSRVTDETRYDVVVSYNSGGLRVEEGYTMPWTQTICHDALSLRRNAFEDVQEELPDNSTGAEFGFHTYVTCPVVGSGGKLIGTLCGASDRVKPLTPQQVDLVRRFARLVGDRIKAS